MFFNPETFEDEGCNDVNILRNILRRICPAHSRISKTKPAKVWRKVILNSCETLKISREQMQSTLTECIAKATLDQLGGKCDRRKMREADEVDILNIMEAAISTEREVPIEILFDEHGKTTYSLNHTAKVYGHNLNSINRTKPCVLYDGKPLTRKTNYIDFEFTGVKNLKYMEFKAANCEFVNANFVWVDYAADRFALAIPYFKYTDNKEHVDVIVKNKYLGAQRTVTVRL